jgi:hypothetical protein
VLAGEGQIARPSCFASRREIRQLRVTIVKPRDNAHWTVRDPRDPPNFSSAATRDHGSGHSCRRVRRPVSTNSGPQARSRGGLREPVACDHDDRTPSELPSPHQIQCTLGRAGTGSLSGATPRPREVRPSATTGALYQRLLNLRVLWGPGVVTVMVSQDLRRVITRPEGVNSRAPLPLEVEVIVGRLCREAERGCAARGEIGIYGHGLSVEENLIAEIVRIHRRSPAQTRPPCLLTKARRGPNGPYTGLLPRDMRPQAYAAFAPLCGRPVCASGVAAHPPGDRRANALHLRAVVGSWCQPYSPFAAKRRSSIGRCSVTGRTGARHRLLALQHRRWSEQT